MLLLIDNFDSFTYNIVHAFQMLGVEVVVVRNHAFDILDNLPILPQWIVIGPGPGKPSEAKASITAIQKWSEEIPILGICLGHQCIAEFYGGSVVRASTPMHGKVSPIHHQSTGVFAGLAPGFLATRYHSLIVEKDTLPDCLEITAQSPEGEIMGLRHRQFSIEGVQFHPESVMSTEGLQLLRNFLFLPRKTHV